jgi:glycosyltransferase involved in cell wall biosynthesis
VPSPPTEALIRTRADLGLEGAYPVLLSVGRLEANKGQRELVPAFATVAGHHPSARLLIVGEGEDHRALVDEVAAAGLAGQVSVLGRRSDVPVLAALSDVFVSTAHHEGFGMAVLEAMAAGCAVVAYSSDAVAIGEFVEDGVTGRLVAEHPGPLALAIVEVVDDRSALAEMGRRAAAAAAEHTATRSAEAMAAVYRGVAAARSRPRGA